MLGCNYREGALGFVETAKGLRASRLPKSQLSGLPKPLADPSSVPPPGWGTSLHPRLPSPHLRLGHLPAGVLAPRLSGAEWGSVGSQEATRGRLQGAGCQLVMAWRRHCGREGTDAGPSGGLTLWELWN